MLPENPGFLLHQNDFLNSITKEFDLEDYQRHLEDKSFAKLFFVDNFQAP